MPRTQPRFQCRHIHTAGHRCGSPSLRQQDFCYYHTTARPAPRIPDNPPFHPRDEAFDLPQIEDRASIQLAISQIVRRLATNRIDHKRAGLLIYALQAATNCLPREARTPSRPGEPAQAAESTVLLEAVEIDEQLGPIAPVARIPKPGKRRPGQRLSFAETILAEFNKPRPCPNCKLTQDEARTKAAADARALALEQARTLPSLHAAAEPDPPSPRAGGPSFPILERVGYRAATRLSPDRPRPQSDFPTEYHRASARYPTLSMRPKGWATPGVFSGSW